jgi:hypothetical protein
LPIHNIMVGQAETSTAAAVPPHQLPYKRLLIKAASQQQAPQMCFHLKAANMSLA